MSDIVERLRSGEPCCEASGNNCCKIKEARSGCLCAEAADTITALMEEVERLQAYIANDADWKFSAKRRLQLFREQRQANARLREALNKADRWLALDAPNLARDVIRAALSTPPATQEKCDDQG